MSNAEKHGLAVKFGKKEDIEPAVVSTEPKKKYWLQVKTAVDRQIRKDLGLEVTLSDVACGQQVLFAAYLFSSLPTAEQQKIADAYTGPEVPIVAKRY